MYAIRSYYGKDEHRVDSEQQEEGAGAGGMDGVRRRDRQLEEADADLGAVQAREQRYADAGQARRRGRITSYNVCYTKLLRYRRAGAGPDQQIHCLRLLR